MRIIADMRSAILLVMTLSMLFGFSWAGGTLISKRQATPASPQDPTDICDRRYHSSVVVGEKLWINGGQNVKNRTESTEDYTAFPYIQYIDLSTSWTLNSPKLTTQTKPSSVVTVQEACAWSDGVNFYQYGGWRSSSSEQESFRVWDYDGSEWSPVSPGTVNRLASGAGTDAPMIKKSYAYGGFQNSQTTSDPYWIAVGTGYGSPNLIEFDWETKIARNVTYTDQSNDPAGTLDNGVAYVPVGDQGILVAISGRRSNLADGFSQLSGFSEIRVFDIASSTWYYQTTQAASSVDGIPKARVQACTVVMPAADNSSYNIYMFGGSSNDGINGSFNDMWVLSLPSFKWIRIQNTSGNSGYIPGARTSHTCNLIGKRQMAVIGGARSAAAHKQCDTRSIFVFDMTRLIWRSAFDPNEVAYELPKNITNVIGGDEFGNAVASKNKPDTWTNPAVEDIFFGSDVPQPTASASSTATPDDTTPPESPTPTGAIVGGVVGGVAALAAIAFGLFFLRRRRHRRGPVHHNQDDESKINPNQNAQELSGETEFHELDPGDATLHELGGDYYARRSGGAGEYSALNELDAELPSPRTETVDGVERFAGGAKLSPTTKKPVDS
ncbi:hypothetical protein DFP73DRAFT_636328 [Morchella snyderi]|nr:hypothetical protein DFP73DRAFT_636328 [Morchella snyderi]